MLDLPVDNHGLFLNQATLPDNNRTTVSKYPDFRMNDSAVTDSHVTSQIRLRTHHGPLRNSQTEKF